MVKSSGNFDEFVEALQYGICDCGARLGGANYDFNTIQEKEEYEEYHNSGECLKVDIGYGIKVDPEFASDDECKNHVRGDD